MSTILDALKKSERDRTVVRGVGFGDASRYWAPRPDHTWRWIAVAIAFGLMLIAIILLWSRNQVAAPTLIAVSETYSESPALPAVSSANEPPPVATPSSVISPDVRDAAFLSTLPSSFQQSLPPMTVTIHVYVPNDVERILYINNQQYRPGDEIAGGVIVEGIVPDGAVLRFHQQRFKLPRPS